jgi:ADP-ribose pyrophosphatase YjhB (NUDIX family)
MSSMEDKKRTEPPFVPREGQIDYTHAKVAPVISCIVMYNEKILLVQRSMTMNLHPGKWAGISGFLDEPHKTVEEKVREEMREELGIVEEDILSIEEHSEVIEEEDEEYDKTWLFHPVLVTVGTDRIDLNWEGEQYEWVDPADVHDFDLIPNFDKILDAFSL